MDWYSFFKFLHIVAAIVWLGGGFTMILVSARADHAGDHETLMVLLRTMARLGGYLFMPMSLATLVFGLVMATVWTGFSELWVIIGLIGYAAAFLTGVLILKPSSEKIAAMLATEGITPAAVALGRRMLRFGKFDYVIMTVVVADMVLKPTAHDVAILGAMALLVVSGAVLIFGGATRPNPVAA